MDYNTHEVYSIRRKEKQIKGVIGMQFRIDSSNVIVITKYTGHETNVIVPSEINGIPVTRIDNNAFSDCLDVESIILPESIKEIGEGAFERCKSLKSIVLPESVLVIERDAFLNCKSLEMITILNKDCHIYNSFDNYPFVSKFHKTICNCCSEASEYNAWFGIMDTYKTAYSGVIRGYKGSTAEEYAKNYCRFEPID